ncbi:hypothetical protein [Chryseobacterium gleum]|uniref:hypothetical protein n=1 Tax=Chryseobacterium gleum TaxID=250 RepID=UPI00241CD2E9|nr:hypothetical protein [Chryseobacterium gleum]
MYAGVEPDSLAGITGFAIPPNCGTKNFFLTTLQMGHIKKLEVERRKMASLRFLRLNRKL